MRWQSERRLVEWQEEWLVRAVLAGFVATMAMSGVLVIAYGIAVAFGSASPQASLLLHWFWGLAHNVVTSQVQTTVPLAVLLHVVAGIAWAVVYARLVEPHLSGPGWRRGLLFAPIPGVLSLGVFLPALGGGILGLGLGAGPLPIVGNLVLHLVYGVTLGSLYPAESDRLLIERGEAESPEEVQTMIQAEHAMALGIVLGLALGRLGGWLCAVTVAPSVPALVAAMCGAVLGSAGGALIGSYSGLATARR